MDINLTLIMQAVAFAAFIWFTARFVWPPLMGAIETRRKTIADGLAAGEQGRANLANAEKRTADLLAQAKAQADDIVAAAKAEITQEVARAKESLRTAVAELAVAGASKILKREVDPKAHAELLREIQGQL